MTQNKSLRSKLVGCLVATILIVLVGLAGILVFPVVNTNGGAFGEQLMNQLQMVKEAFLFPFNFKEVTTCQQACPGIWNAFSFDDGNALSPVLPMALSVGVMVMCFLFLFGLVVGLIVVIKKKKAKFAGYAALMLVVTFMCAMVLMNSKLAGNNGYFDPTMQLIQKADPAPAIVTLIVGLVAIVFTLVAFIMTIVTYGIGLKYANHPLVKDEGELIEEAQPVLAEEAVTNEVVEENVEEVVEETVEEMPEVEPEPEEIISEEVILDEPEPEAEEEKKVEVTVNNNQPQPALDTNSLATLLREVVRDIVRDEISRNNLNQPKQEQPQNTSSTVTGATFGGPLVVQYFNGGINGVTPQPGKAAPAPAPVQAAPEAPVAEEAAPVAEPAAAPEAVAAPVVEEQKEVKVYERISFAERLFGSEKDLQDNYNEIKNEILSWGVKSRISSSGDSFRLHKKMYVKLTIAGKSLKLYFALDPADYESSTIPVQDASNKAAYQDTPLCFKVKSGLSMRRCKELIQATMEKDGLEQGEVMKVNWVKELKAEMKAGKKQDKSKKSEEDED